MAFAHPLSRDGTYQRFGCDACEHISRDPPLTHGEWAMPVVKALRKEVGKIQPNGSDDLLDGAARETMDEDAAVLRL